MLVGSTRSRKGGVGRTITVFKLERAEHRRLYAELIPFRKGAKRVNRLRLLAYDGLRPVRARHRRLRWRVKHRSKRRRAHAMVSASELAQMGRCEQLVVFEHRHGQRRLPHQEAARRQGLAAHERFEQEGLSVRSAGLRQAGRCFVASLLFGKAWQTQALRQLRDKVLRPRGWGRGLIRLNYRGAPSVCAVLERWPVLRRPGRAVLGVFAAVSRLVLGGAAPR